MSANQKTNQVRVRVVEKPEKDVSVKVRVTKPAPPAPKVVTVRVVKPQ
jgi:hypothetical protein